MAQPDGSHAYSRAEVTGKQDKTAGQPGACGPGLPRCFQEGGWIRGHTDNKGRA